MKTRGLLFYADAFKPIPELVLALHSFMKYNNDTVHVTLGPKAPKWFQDELNNANISNSRLAKRLNPTGRRNKVGHWLQKPYVIAESPFDVTFYYDCDHVFLRSIPETKWDLVDQMGLSTGHELGDIVAPRRKYLKWRHHIHKAMGKEVLPNTNENYYRVNGGCIGFSKDEGRELVDVWKWFLEKFKESENSKEVLYVGDEVGLSATLNLRMQGWLGENCSTQRHPYHVDVTEIPKNTIAWHFARSQYQRGDKRTEIWLDAFASAWEDNFLNLKTCRDKYLKCNVSVNENFVGSVI
jgi:hypothetical protein